MGLAERNGCAGKGFRHCPSHREGMCYGAQGGVMGSAWGLHEGERGMGEGFVIEGISRGIV